MFLGLPDPHPDPLVTSTDTYTDTDRMLDQFVTQVSFITFEYSRFRIFILYTLVQHFLACVECAAYNCTPNAP